MTEPNVILITGVSGFWGAKLAHRLLTRCGEEGSDKPAHVLGLDSNPPDPEIEGLDFIQADVRNPLLGELLQDEQVHTVYHLAFEESAQPSEANFDFNVMGVIKVLGTCAEAGVQKVILKSATAVYGALPTNPSFLTEDSPLKASQAYGLTRDLVEIEAFCNGFSRQAPEMCLTRLRFAPIIGPEADTPMTRFLGDPRMPSLLGFDPMMQIIHERDVIEALVQAGEVDAPGPINVAAEGVMPLARLAALAGKLPVPVFHPLAYWGAALLGGRGLRVLPGSPVMLDYLRYPCVGDLERMRTGLGFTPRYTAEEALREFAGQQRLRKYMPESAALEYDQERLRDTLERRRRMRARQAGELQEEDE